MTNPGAYSAKAKTFLREAKKAKEAEEIEADFEECALDDKKLDRVVDVLTRHQLRGVNVELYLTRNDLTNESIPILSRGLRDARFRLTTLAIRANLLSANSGVELGKLITAAADGDPDCYFLNTLTTLDIACNELGNKGACAIAEALALSNCTLTDVDLGSNCIGSRGAVALAEALDANPDSRLTSLELRLNQIGGSGGEAFANTLDEGWKGVVYLGLAMNNLSEESMTHLGDAVHGRGEMEELNVWGNVMSLKGINSLKTVSGPHIHYGWNENVGSMTSQLHMSSPYKLRQEDAKNEKRKKKAKKDDNAETEGDGGGIPKSSHTNQGWDRIWRSIRVFEGKRYKERTLAKLPTRKRPPLADGTEQKTLSDKKEALLIERISKDIRRFEDQRARNVTPGMTREEQKARLDKLSTERSKNIAEYQRRKQHAIHELGYDPYDPLGFTQ